MSAKLNKAIKRLQAASRAHEFRATMRTYYRVEAARQAVDAARKELASA